MLHSLPAHCKIVATLLFVAAVIITPRESYWAFGSYTLMVLVLSHWGRVPLPILVRRLSIEIPFVLFALFLPFVVSGPRIDIGPLAVSYDGLLAAWNIVAKATLGVAATTLLASSTQPAELIHGLGRLRMPKLFVAIAAFMVRYADLITGEVRRMRIARESRGYEPHLLWHTRALASSAGTLFIRSFERGERVYLAMLSRGYSGHIPLATGTEASIGLWALTLLAPSIALVVAALAWTLS
jgi:cobalt/nickel transport system permease protein